MDSTSGAPRPELHLGPPVRHAGSVHLSVAGDIDMTTVERFTVTLATILDEADVQSVTLDLGRLHFIDSNGVTAIVRTHWIARGRGIALTVSNAGGPIRETLEMLGVYHMLTGKR